MYCGKCGKINTDEIRFCVHCGADLAQQTPQPTEPVSPAETIADTDDLRRDLDLARRPTRKSTPPSTPTPTPEGDQSHLISIEELRPGRVLAGRYRISARLGVGGMGEVFQASDEEINDITVAVKVLPPILATNSRSINRLRDEASISLKLTHGNICRLHTFSAAERVKFLVMEYIPGQTLEDILDGSDNRRMTLEEILPIAGNIADALDYAHGLKPPILHRDIKPSNVMVMPSGVAKVLDFGIARELKDSMTRVTGKDTSGTLLYMSPEQFTGATPTTASDIYSFAAMLYECFAGHAPFWQGSIAHQLLNQKPAKIRDISNNINEALLSGLAKNVDDRPATAQKLVSMLGNGKVSLGRPAAKPKPESEPKKPSKRKHSLLKVAASVVIAICLMAAVAAVGVKLNWWPASLTGWWDKTSVTDAIALVDVNKVRAEAEKQWRSIKDISRGQGFAASLDKALALQGIAAENTAKKQYTQAKATYAQIVDLCGQIARQDSLRHQARAELDIINRKKIEMEKTTAPELAATIWKDACKEMDTGLQAFEAGEFDNAKKIFALVNPKFLNAERHALLVARLGVAKKAYEQALKQTDSETLRIYGGKARQLAEAAVKSARDAGETSEAVGKWETATTLLKEAWLTASVEKVALEKIEQHKSKAEELSKAGKYKQAIEEANKALVIKGDSPAVKTLIERITARWLVAQAKTMLQDNPLQSLQKAESAKAKLKTLLAANPNDKELLSLAKQAASYILFLESLYRQEKKILAHDKWITSLAFLPDGKRLASGSLDSTIKMWSVPAGQCLRTISASSGVSAVACSPDATRLAWAVGAKLMLADARSGALFRTLEGHILTILSVTYCPTGKQIATGASDNTIRLWNMSTGKCTAVLKHSDGINCVAYGPGGKLLVSGSADKTVKIWDVKSAKMLRELTGHETKVLSVAFSSDGKLIASADDDRKIRLWNAADGKCLRIFADSGGAVSSVAFSLDGKSLASSGADKMIRVWNIKTGQCVQILAGHTDWVRVVRFTRDGKYLVSCGDDKTIIIWKRGLK